MPVPILPRPSSNRSNPFDRDALEDSDEFEDTQPSGFFPDDVSDDDFGDAPTVPGFRLRADGSLERDSAARAFARESGQWDRALRAVAVAVRRVFTSHSIS